MSISFFYGKFGLKIETHRLPLCVPSPFNSSTHIFTIFWIVVNYDRHVNFLRISFYGKFGVRIETYRLPLCVPSPFKQITPMRALPLQFIYSHFHNLLNSSKLRSTCQFPSDILLWQIWGKNWDVQITPMRALPLQTTLLTHSGTLHSQETWKWTAPPTGP